MREPDNTEHLSFNLDRAETVEEYLWLRELYTRAYYKAECQSLAERITKSVLTVGMMWSSERPRLSLK